MTNFAIDIVSDPVCPWCYIGKRRLDKAIALYQKVYPSGRQDTFTINWKAYYLDSTAPAKGISWDERLLQKLASTRSKSNPDLTATEEDNKVVAQQLKTRLATIGRQEGIQFSFQGKIGNTRSAHRAIAFSKTHANLENESAQQVQDRFVTALFEAYFEGDIDITSHEALADVAASVGLDRAEMLAWLDSGEGGEEVDEEDRAARARGIEGVPCFTVQGVKVDGAQDVQDLMEMFVKVKEEERQI
ncbi:DSBA-like thioredoxin domain-containing protein [Xylaria flabelliformis]|nr:DSBA-like thioredoxin domain-containing protein [Xylaria flabelliformis]